jgi:hypothetical protein
MNGTIPEEHGPADPDPEPSNVIPPPVPPPKQVTSAPTSPYPPPTPSKEAAVVPLPPTPSALDPPGSVITTANGIEVIPESN